MTKYSTMNLSFFSSTVCREGNVRILDDANSHHIITTLPDGNISISGIVEVCINGEWASTCDLYPIDPSSAKLACERIGYYDG